MVLFNLFNVAFAAPMALTLVTSAPTTSAQLPSPYQEPQYFLRIYSPGQPWHTRHLVQLPSSHLLGLENFTVHPTTPPIHMFPFKIPAQETYALIIPYGGDDLSKPFYITAFQSMGTRTASLGIIQAPDPTNTEATPGMDPQPCPRDKECVANAFLLYQPTPEDGKKEDGAKPFRRLGYEGFPGQWEAVKDAPHSEGWHVYWKAKGGRRSERAQGTAIEIEVVPVGAGEGQSTRGCCTRNAKNEFTC